MIDKPLVSIIIPCHNDGEYLLEAVTSAKFQTLPSCEVIIANDHSNDPYTLEVLRKLQEQGERVVNVPEGRRGPSAARNHAIMHSRGSYILPLDADDRIAADYARQAVEVLSSRPEVGLCYCHAELFGMRSGPWILESYSYEKLLCSNMIFCSAMFRRTDFDRIKGYDESLYQGYEDWAFWIKLLEHGRQVVCLDDVLFYYRKHGISHSSSTDKKHYSSIFAVIRSCHKQYMKHLPNYIILQCKRIFIKIFKIL